MFADLNYTIERMSTSIGDKHPSAESGRFG